MMHRRWLPSAGASSVVGWGEHVNPNTVTPLIRRSWLPSAGASSDYSNNRRFDHDRSHDPDPVTGRDRRRQKSVRRSAAGRVQPVRPL